MEWTFFKDSNPPKDGKVLVFYETIPTAGQKKPEFRHDVGKFVNGKLMVLGNYFAFDMCKEVVAWAPLTFPEGYENR